MSVEKVHGDVQPNEALSPDYRSGKAVGYATSSGSRESEESVDLYQTSDDRRQIGLVSAIFLYVLSAFLFLVVPANALR